MNGAGISMEGWQAIVTGERQRAGCILCGGMHLKMRRMVNVAWLDDVLRTQAEHNIEDEVHLYTKNILQATKASNQNIVVVCSECRSWQDRRKDRTPVQILPMQAMLWFLRTHIGHADTDGRLLQRIGKMLLQEGNYYTQLFSATELKLCEAVQEICVQHVMQFIATHMHATCGHSLFTSSSKTAEQLREISKHGFRTRRTRLSKAEQKHKLSLMA